MAEETNKRMSQLIVFRQITLVETGFNLTEHVDRIYALVLLMLLKTKSLMVSTFILKYIIKL